MTRGPAVVVATSLAVAGLPCAAQVIEPATPNRIEVLTPEQAARREGYSAKRLIDAEVRIDGKAIGEVHDILVNEVGKVTAMVVEAGDALDVRDRHFRVPWHEVRIARGARHVEVPGRHAALASPRGPEAVHVRTSERRVTELLQDTKVADYIVDARGDVKALVVE